MQPDEGGWPAGAEAQRGARPPAREAGERGTPGAMPPSPTPTALVSGVGTVGTVRHLGAAPAGRGSARTSEPRGLSLAPGPTSFSSVPAHPCRRGVRLPSCPLPKVCWKRWDGGGRRAPRAKRDRARRPGREEGQHRPLRSREEGDVPEHAAVEEARAAPGPRPASRTWGAEGRGRGDGTVAALCPSCPSAQPGLRRADQRAARRRRLGAVPAAAKLPVPGRSWGQGGGAGVPAVTLWPDGTAARGRGGRGGHGRVSGRRAPLPAGQRPTDRVTGRTGLAFVFLPFGPKTTCGAPREEGLEGRWRGPRSGVDAAPWAPTRPPGGDVEERGPPPLPRTRRGPRPAGGAAGERTLRAVPRAGAAVTVTATARGRRGSRGGRAGAWPRGRRRPTPRPGTSTRPEPRPVAAGGWGLGVGASQ